MPAAPHIYNIGHLWWSKLKVEARSPGSTIRGSSGRLMKTDTDDRRRGRWLEGGNVTLFWKPASDVAASEDEPKVRWGAKGKPSRVSPN